MKLSKKYPVIIGGIVLIVLVAGVPVRAAEERADQRRMLKKKRFAQTHIFGKERPKEILETIRTVRTIETLKLDEEQIAQVLPKQRRMREVKHEFHQSRKERIEELEGLLKSKASSQDLESALENLKAQEKAFRERTVKLKEEINGILTPEQRARLIIFERNFRKEMREMLKKHPKGERPLEKIRELRRKERRPLEEELPLEEAR